MVKYDFGYLGIRPFHYFCGPSLMKDYFGMFYFCNLAYKKASMFEGDVID